MMKKVIVFPIEVDLSPCTFTYYTSNQFNDGIEDKEEVKEEHVIEISDDLISTD
jgi:hypothetical protein